MGTDLGTIAIFSLIIFGALEFALVIIPSMISRSKIQYSYEPVYDVPVVLSRPVPSRQMEQMRSWYSDETGQHRFIRTIDLGPGTPGNSGYPGRDDPSLPGKSQHLRSVRVKDWKAVNNANRAILRANKAVLEANHAILEANTAIHQAGEDDLEWIDEIAGLDQLRGPPKK
jgi:hypothetical protein